MDDSIHFEVKYQNKTDDPLETVQIEITEYKKSK